MAKENSKGTLDSTVRLTIGAMAKALKVNQVTLRTYDSEGILKPERTGTNRRDYTLNDLDKGRVILFITRNLFLDLNAVKLLNAVFEDKGIKNPAEQLEYLEKIAQKAGFTKEIQAKNIEKAVNRGTKAKSQKS